MSDARRAIARAVGRLAGRLGRVLGRPVSYLASIDGETLLGAVFALGVGLAVGIVVLAGFLPGTVAFFDGLLYVFASLLPFAGLVLLVVVVRRQIPIRTGTPEPIRSPPPEEGVSEADRPPGRELRRELAGVTASRYRCRSPSGEPVRTRLHRAAVRRTRTRRGHDAATARSIVDAGEWTDDPVAAAFLSEETPYPLAERLRAAVDPGRAYRRRVRRTLDAIQRADESPAGTSIDGRSADADESAPETATGAIDADGSVSGTATGATDPDEPVETATGATDGRVSEVME